MNFEIPQAVKTWSQFGHPLLMWVLFGLSIYALYLGIKSKRTRTADKEARKELIGQKFNTRHHQIGSLLLALMVLGTIGGMAVTYINNEKLFVSSHLLVGLGMTGIIATAASLVPYMQKGNDIARKAHVGLNMMMVCLFAWQAVSGVQILQRIIGKM
jgi:Protein of unknown function (DUF4079)